ncbi:hypothetical protein M8494_28770 [Serratia ureilytica]
MKPSSLPAAARQHRAGKRRLQPGGAAGAERRDCRQPCVARQGAAKLGIPGAAQRRLDLRTIWRCRCAAEHRLAARRAAAVLSTGGQAAAGHASAWLPENTEFMGPAQNGRAAGARAT